MVMDDALLERAGDLKQQLVTFSEQPRYEKAAARFFSRLDGAPADFDDQRLAMMWDVFVLEYKLANGRTVVEQFVARHPDLSEAEREMLLGWRNVVQSAFEVIQRDGPTLVVENLVDEMTYRVRSNMGPRVFRQTPPGSYILARMVAVGDEWMLSSSFRPVRAADRDIAYGMALDVAVQMPQVVFRNPEKLALAWDQQNADRDAFIRFFGTDQVVLPGDQAQGRWDEFSRFRREAISGLSEEDPGPGVGVLLPPAMAESETVAFIYDETDGLGYYADLGLVEEAFADPTLIEQSRWREHVLGYLRDDTVEPMVFRRIAERDPEKAGAVFRQLLDRPQFEWNRDGEELLREFKADYYLEPPRPRISPVSERLAEYARRR